MRRALIYKLYMAFRHAGHQSFAKGFFSRQVDLWFSGYRGVELHDLTLTTFEE